MRQWQNAFLLICIIFRACFVHSVILFVYESYYSPYNMVAQANNTGTSKNMTNEKVKKNNDSSTLHT